MQSIQKAATTVGIIGVVALIYAGLGWLSGMRTALHVVFELPIDRRPNFVVGKLRDLLTLAVVGSTLLVSVAVIGCRHRASPPSSSTSLGLEHGLPWTVDVVGCRGRRWPRPP